MSGSSSNAFFQNVFLAQNLAQKKESFVDQLDLFPREQIADILENEITPKNVEQALLRAGKCSLYDFLALLSPVADPYLEEMARISQKLTQKRFGNTISIFLPVYLSNECSNVCTYCGFSHNNDVERITLNKKQITKEIEAIKKKGVQQVLILTGEDHRRVGMDYFKETLPLFRDQFREVIVEIQPLETEEYKTLRNLGVDGVCVYQETYHKENYRIYHPKGKKSHFTYRIDAPFRACESGMHKIGLGVLLGLENWRIDSFFCALHLKFLQKNFWKARFSLSFPRLRPASGISFTNEMKKKFPSDADLAKLIFAYRLLDEDLSLTLSTRETPNFRNHMIGLGITSISAESKTHPGGYACFPEKGEQLEQFSTDDNRNILEMTKVIKENGMEPVFYDWMSEMS